ncbi:hypothetical protein ACTFIR_008214 [Dictyostelium discoideum]
MSNNIKFLQCFKFVKNLNLINNVKPNYNINKNQFKKTSIPTIKTLSTNINILNNFEFEKNENIKFFSTFNKFSRGGGVSLKKSGTTTATNNNNNNTKIKTKELTESTSDSTNENGYKFNFINPDSVAPFKPRHLPYETTTDLDFLVPPGLTPIESSETLNKYLKLAKALSAIGFEHQENEKWEEALESYNKALFYIRNIFASEKTRDKIDLRDFALLLSNSAESYSRVDKMTDAMTRSKQSIDLLEVYWKNQVLQFSSSKPSIRSMWKKDEMLGVFCSNYSEYLIFDNKFEEAEPYLVRAHEILEKIYPLNHPVNIEIGISLVKVLNEMGRSKEVEKIFDKYGDTITDAMGKTEEFKHISEKVETDIKHQMIEQIKEQYPELDLDHKDFEDDDEEDIERNKYLDDKERLNQYIENNNGDLIEYDENGNLTFKNNKNRKDDQDDDDDEDNNIKVKSKYSELEFDINDLLLLEQDKIESKQQEMEIRKQKRNNGELLDQEEDDDDDDENLQFKERDFDELNNEDDEDDFDLDFGDEGDEDEGDREDLGREEIHPREEMLNIKLEQDEDLMKQKGIKVFSTRKPLGNVLNEFDSLFDEATEKYTEIQNERVIDREERLINKHSGIPEKVIYKDGKIITPTDKHGEPISQGAIDKWGKFYAEDLIQEDINEEEDVLNDYIGKMGNLMESMSKKESDQLDKEFKSMYPKFKKLLSQPNPEKYLNTSLMDVEEDEKQRKELIIQEIKEIREYLKELKDEGYDDNGINDESIDDDDNSFLENDYDFEGNDDKEINNNNNNNIIINNNIINNNNNNISETNYIDFINTARELNFDEDKIIKKIGEREFENLQNRFNINQENDDDDEEEKLISDIFNNSNSNSNPNKKQQKQNQIQDDETESFDNDDDSLRGLLKELEELDGDQSYNDDETIDLEEFEDLDDLDDDQVVDESNPEKDLEKYLKKVSKTNSFKEFIDDIKKK